MHFNTESGTEISLVQSKGVALKPIFLAAAAGNSASRSGVIEKMIDIISSFSIEFLFRHSERSSSVDSMIDFFEFSPAVIAPLRALTFFSTTAPLIRFFWEPVPKERLLLKVASIRFECNGW